MKRDVFTKWFSEVQSGKRECKYLQHGVCNLYPACTCNHKQTEIYDSLLKGVKRLATIRSCAERYNTQEPKIWQ
jgi:hypothetical protein